MASRKMSALDERLQKALDSRQSRQMLRSLTPEPSTSTSSSQPLVDFSSNDYLSLSKSTLLRQSFLKALSTSSQPPYGPPSSRLLDGNSPLHLELEGQLARFLRGDSALLFNSGFDANVGLWSCLPAKEDVVVYDELIHASTHDGMRASRVPPNRRLPFRHNNVDHLRSVLEEFVKRDEGVRMGKCSVWVGVETLYSMDGDLSPLREIVDLVDQILPRGNGHLVVDEAHSTGLYGPQGRGVVCALGLANRITIRLHTFGKAMACSGGVVLCNPLIRSYLINYARPLIYSTVLPTMNVMAISSAFTHLEAGQGDGPAAHIHALATLLYSSLSTFLSSNPPSPVTLPPILPVPTPSLATSPLGASQMPLTTPILPLLTSQPRALSTHLKVKGFLVRPISYPTVPRGQERVRVCLHAGNSFEEVRELSRAVREWVDLEVRRGPPSASSVIGKGKGKEARLLTRL